MPGLSRPVLLLFLLAACFRLSAGQEVPKSSTTMQIGGGQIEISLPDEPMKVSTEELLAWIRSAATAVTEYYGHFPVEHVDLHIRAGGGSGVHHGVTFPTGGGRIFIRVGQDTPVEELKNDWTLTHEMTHLAFPNMVEAHHWIEEGIAVYVEPVARAQIGQLPISEVWRQFIRDMPKGQPDTDDEGLDNTHTWGRTYWGGAIFCLMADVEIRAATHNKKGLQDALRAVLDHGGQITQDWDIEKAFSIGDQATGTKVLQKLYAQMSNKPVTVDLNNMWEKLGLSMNDGEVKFNDKAVQASIRKAITAPVQSAQNRRILSTP